MRGISHLEFSSRKFIACVWKLLPRSFWICFPSTWTFPVHLTLMRSWRGRHLTLMRSWGILLAFICHLSCPSVFCKHSEVESKGWMNCESGLAQLMQGSAATQCQPRWASVMQYVLWVILSSWSEVRWPPRSNLTWPDPPRYCLHTRCDWWKGHLSNQDLDAMATQKLVSCGPDRSRTPQERDLSLHPAPATFVSNLGKRGDTGTHSFL